MALRAHLEDSVQKVDDRHEPRRRLRLETSGVAPDGAEANVTVHNLSAAGLLIETDLELRIGARLAVDLPQVGPVGAEIVWASERLFGCAFEQALGEAALAAAQRRGEVTQIDATRSAGGRASNVVSRTSDPLGMRLNRLRRERGMTLAQVAAALEVSKPTVWAWEKGKARPLPERIGAIASVLGVAEADLLDAGEQSASASLVEECRVRIASEYGIGPDRVRIMIEV
jgi:transcriptional regulator with XRE-family HTH domain